MRLEPIADIDAARADWRRLAQASGNLFSTWEWASVWWRHLGGGRPLHLTAARAESGEVTAILPFFLARERPLRVLRFVGHGPADRLEPICAPGDRAFAAGALRAALDERVGGWHVAIADRLPGEEGWASLLEARVFRTEPSPVLVSEGRDWDAFLASRSKNF
ncbi:MAG: hypothetical protein ACJ760_11700, partial [Thermoleophilaceae bacterium]